MVLKEGDFGIGFEVASDPRTLMQVENSASGQSTRSAGKI